MCKANETQVDGEHYRIDYQHWDFIIDTNLHYILACATKYLARYLKKNGSVDLEKAIHYLVKATENNIYPVQDKKLLEKWVEFFNQLEPIQQAWFMLIYGGEYEEAINNIALEMDKLREVENAT